MASLLTALLGRVVAKAGDALVSELLRAWGLDKSRRKLERYLAAVQCILLDADAKSRTNPAVLRWMTDLKTAAYQADDVLDDFRYEALRLRADAQIRPRSKARKVLSYFTANSPVVFRLSMSRKMKDALEMIDELVVEMNNFHFIQHAETLSVDNPQTHSQVDESEIVGRQNEKEQVVKMLLDHSDSDTKNNVMVLPIVGMGGIGKTTLAQLVHNDRRMKHHFELVIWACVSDKFVIEEIIRSVIEVTTMNKCDLTQMEALQKKLGEVLGKKRYLLMLDDVWSEDRQKWDDMRSLLCSHAGSGSAIIVTSRSNQVASIMGTLPPHQISLLSEDQSWELFQRNTFGRAVEKQEELISMAKSIVQKCKGLPLAIKTVAALLRSKHHRQWFSFLDSDVWKDDILRTTGIVPALQLSYDHLSSDAQICFSFCAIFPMDSPMNKDMLIQLWMANDFIASETRGQQIFDLLVWRCFLQEVEIQKNPLSGFRNGFDQYIRNDDFMHRPTTCKMHDLMHDLADSNLHHIKKFYKDPQMLVHYSMMFDICHLIMRLPEGMRYMSSLRHIFLVGCYRLERMPQGTGQLSSLQTLTNYVIDSDPGRGIDQLKDLDLGGALSLTELRKVHSVENAKQGNMSAKHNLKRLSLSWANRPPYGYEVDTNAEGILEALCPNKRLEVLLLSNYTGAKLSSWMHNSTVLEHLSELCLSSCKNCKDLPPLWQLPSLRYLSLNGLHSLTSICAGNDHTNIGESCISLPPFFPKLEIMIVSDMIKLERWHQEVPGQVPAISFPQLKKLDVSACPMLASMPKTLPLIEDLLVTGANDIPLYHLMNMSVQSNLECKGYIEVGWRLIHLHFSRLGDSNVRLGLRGLRENVEHFEEELSRIPCRFIKVLDITNYDCLFSFELSQVQQNIWDHFGFVEKLSIENCNNIVQWPAVEFRNMNCLRVLNLIDCSNLTGSLPLAISDEENDHLPRLQNLSISCCNNLVEVPKLPASLESLSIRCCPKLVSMPRNLGSVKKLRELSLIRCDALTAFPDGTYGVTALRTLVMEWCPRVETLPEGLLQQLPTLGRLRITGCPNLEEAFSSRGTHWNFVEAIPNRSVGKSMR
ncbi:putative disease resistance protein RGA3 [Aegilops tauschii subsp. strangulata]|uniref:Putative disease resistance protein RGA3 n=1 Tax=Aegilops tauschii TaxID=37682 RepID=M8C8F7_AEGTA|nr:putative disease resistance protein RGA3 isoform X2 [Triticum aestivum]